MMCVIVTHGTTAPVGLWPRAFLPFILHNPELSYSRHLLQSFSASLWYHPDTWLPIHHCLWHHPVYNVKMYTVFADLFAWDYYFLLNYIREKLWFVRFIIYWPIFFFFCKCVVDKDETGIFLHVKCCTLSHSYVLKYIVFVYFCVNLPPVFWIWYRIDIFLGCP